MNPTKILLNVLSQCVSGDQLADILSVYAKAIKSNRQSAADAKTAISALAKHLEEVAEQGVTSLGEMQVVTLSESEFSALQASGAITERTLYLTYEDTALTETTYDEESKTLSTTGKLDTDTLTLSLGGQYDPSTKTLTL